MRKERFDFICSLGSSCLCATSLRDAGLRLSSGPFDWLLGPSLRHRVELIANDFDGWFEKGDFQFLGNPNKFAHDSYKNTKTGYKFAHDFEIGVSFDVGYPAVRAKYNRRIARFYERTRASKRVLFVWLENPVENDRPTDADISESLAVLAAKFPGVKVELLVVDRAPDDSRVGSVVRGDGYWRATCPYRRKSTEPGKDVRPWDIDTHPIMALMSNFEAVDYRNASDRRAHEAEDRRAKYAAFGAHTMLGYAVAKLQVKVCKLLLNRLRRRGVDIRRTFEVQIGGMK